MEGKAVRKEEKYTGAPAEQVGASSILVFTSPPGGTIDPAGALAGSLPYLQSSLSAAASTSPFPVGQEPVLAAMLQQSGLLVSAQFDAITPVVPTATGQDSWTYVGYIPSALRPSSPVTTAIFANNGSAVITIGAAVVDTAGTVTLYPDSTLTNDWALQNSAVTGVQGWSAVWFI